MSVGVSEVGTGENLKGPENYQDGHTSQANLRGKWGLMSTKALEGSQIPIRAGNVGPLPLPQVGDGSENMNNPMSAIMTIGQSMDFLKKVNCSVSSPFLCCL